MSGLAGGKTAKGLGYRYYLYTQSNASGRLIRKQFIKLKVAEK